MRHWETRKNEGLLQRRAGFKTIVWSAVLMALGTVYGQKKPLDHTVYDSWETIGKRSLSTDGKYVFYTVDVQEGDKTLYIAATHSDFKERIARADDAVFTFQADYAIFNIKPFYKDIKAVKGKKMKEALLTLDSLAIFDLAQKSLIKIPQTGGFKIPSKGSSVLAYWSKSETDSTAGVKKPTKKRKDAKKFTDLVFLDLKSGYSQTFPDVVDYTFDESGMALFFHTQKEIPNESVASENDSDEATVIGTDSIEKPKSIAGVYRFDVKTRTLNQILEGAASYSQLSVDSKGLNWSVLGTHDEEKALLKTYTLYLLKEKQLVKEITRNEKGMPTNWMLSGDYKPQFSENGTKLYVGAMREPVVKDTTLNPLDYAVVDIWHYKEDYLMPQQLANLEKDQKKSHLAVYDLIKNTFVLVATDSVNQSELLHKGDSEFVLNRTDYGRRVSKQWDILGSQDYFLTHVHTGENQTVVQNLKGRAFASPMGQYIVYQNLADGQWYTYQVQTKQTRVLSAGLPVSFVDETFDMPDYASSYGIAGWTENDAQVLIRDRFDIWIFDLKGKQSPRMLTQGYGRKEQISFNLVALDPDQTAYSEKEPLIAVGFDHRTKDSGLFSFTLKKKSTNPIRLRTDAYLGYNTLIKAAKAPVYAYVKSSFDKSPNLYYTTDLVQETQISRTNPQQETYNWGTSELIAWTTPKGFKAAGVLYKPEDFDASKSYPMIVYFYEKLTDNLNRYEPAAPTASRLSITYFISNGYLVFTPDIAYWDGHPGEAAAEYVNSGVDYLKGFSWVDGRHIGIQGQSWGGYQVAHLITVTDRYAAAWAGAPVVNMTSAYGGIRWHTGMSRQFQYEKTQSRIGKDLWEAKDLYLENSPLFALNKVNTPVVIMHNDQDGAVPWYQGIEMFMGLRRLEKPVWLLNYNGDEHNLMKRQNRKDIQIRQQQFFDHYLKGAPAPVWMVRGVPAILKGKDWGLEIEPFTR